MASSSPTVGSEPVAGPMEWLQSNQEQVRLLGYLAVMIGLGVPLATLVSRSHDSATQGTLTRFIVESVTGFGPGLVTLEAFGLGGILTLMLLLLFDDKKWAQGILLWIGLGTLTVGFWLSGFVPRIALQLWAHLGHVALGATAALLLVVPRTVWDSVLDLRIPRRREFRRAPKLIYIAVMGSVVLLYVEYHVVYPPVFSPGTIGEATVGVRLDNLFVDSVTAAGFIVVTRKFMQYEAKKTVAFFGKRNAGKSVLAYCAPTDYMNRVARYADVPPLEISQDLYELLGQGEEVLIEDDGSGPQTGEWFIDNNEQNDLEEFSWTIKDGKLFPKNLQIDIRDHAGENLPPFVKALSGVPIDELDRGNPEVIRALLEQVENADTIVLLIDVAALRDPGDSLDAHLYGEIISEYGASKEIVFAATKADLYDSEFRNETGLDPYNVGNFDRFRRFVTRKIQRESNVIATQMRDVGADAVHPVYVRTVEDENGDRVPVVTDDGDLQPFGHVELQERLK